MIEQAEASQTTDVIEGVGIRIDRCARQAYRGGQSLALGHDELMALEMFLIAGGRVVRFSTIAATLWPDRPMEMRNVRNVVYRLRRKLRTSHAFEAIVGEGYRLVRQS